MRLFKCCKRSNTREKRMSVFFLHPISNSVLLFAFSCFLLLVSLVVSSLFLTYWFFFVIIISSLKYQLIISYTVHLKIILHEEKICCTHRLLNFPQNLWEFVSFFSWGDSVKTVSWPRVSMSCWSCGNTSISDILKGCAVARCCGLRLS